MIGDLITFSGAKIEAWIERNRITSTARFYEIRDRIPGDLVSFSGEGLRRYRELKDFVYRNIIHSFPIARRDGQARLVVRGLFLAFHDNPRLLPDDVLRQYAAGRKLRYLRDISLSEVPREADRNYRFRPEFLRAIADHIAGMTDKFALEEFEDLTAAFPGRGAL
jgi:dGTPase